MLDDCFEEETIHELICSFGLPPHLRLGITTTVHHVHETRHARKSFQQNTVLPIAPVTWMVLA
jgi:hypothetical protein